VLDQVVGELDGGGEGVAAYGVGPAVAEMFGQVEEGGEAAGGAGELGRPAWNVVVPAQIRANLAAREIDCDDVLRALEVPLLVTQGMADTVVLPAMAEHVLATCPTAEASWYEGVGHVPHLEEPERFNRELAGLTRRVRA
jgi:pimeloyl-ACP methyl ester carboxylesterase